MKRDRGLINFDCSKGAMEHIGEWGGLNIEITLYHL